MAEGTDPLERIIGNTPVMRALKKRLKQIASVDHPVLILGESGAGKEVCARALHALSTRAEGPFVGQSCLAIPETLVESELFGHEPGAFTDARERRAGLFEQAQGGTLFLDEIGDVPPAFQKALLRVLQEREVRRLGSLEAIAVNVRIVAATNAPLEKAVAAGQFRSDLMFRLNTFEITVPPLRQRPDDIPLLAGHFAAKHGARFGLRPPELSPEALEKLSAYAWPGNVRELENFVVRWMTLGDEALNALGGAQSALSTDEPSTRRWLNMTLEEIEADVIRMVLADCGGNKTLTAKRLGVARKSLYNKIERYGIDAVARRDAAE